MIVMTTQNGENEKDWNLKKIAERFQICVI